MKNVSDYRAGMLVILGDAAGRRYAEPVLDMGLRQALQTLKRFLPCKETIKQKIDSVSGTEAVINWAPFPGVDILTIKDDAGKWRNAGTYSVGGKLYLHFYYPDASPATGTELLIELAVDHKISGLEGATQTTLPDDLFLTVCAGAAGYAMQIRARSVSEVFGKRPEDTDHLIQQSEDLISQFLVDLRGRQVVLDPLPRGGFEI